MKRSLLFTGILMICLLAAALAFAQQEKAEKATMEPKDQAAMNSMNKNASDILDKKVVNQQGDELGKVEDFIIDENGRIQSVILSSGGFIGIGGEKYTLQWDKFQFQTGEKDQLIADIQEADLEKFQAQKAEQPAEQTGQQQAAQESRPMSQEPAATAQTEAKPADQPKDQAGMEKKAEPAMAAAGGQKSVDEAKDWIGKTVSGQDGEQLGTVNNLFIGAEGNVQYVVISGEDNKLHPVPIELVSQKKDGEGLQAEFSKDVFQNSVSFAQTEAPNLGEPDWENRIRGFYEDKKVDKGGMQEKQSDKTEMKDQQSQKSDMEKKQ